MAGTVIFRPKAKPASIWGAMMSKSPFAEQGELMAAEDPATPLGWVAAKPRRLTPELMSPKPLSGRDLLVDPLPLSDDGGREATVVEPMPDTLAGSAGDDTLDEAPAPRGGFLRRLADHPTMLAGISAGANTPGSFLTGLNAMASQGLAGAGQDEKISVLREQRAQAAKERAARDVFNRMVESGDIQSPRAIAAFNKAYPDQAGALFRELLAPKDRGESYQILTGEDAAALNLDPMKTWQVEQTTGKISQVGGGGVTVNNMGDTADTAWAKKFAEGNAQSFNDRRGGAMDAALSIRANADARKLLDSGIITGAGANWLVGFGKALQQAGFAAEDDAIANTEAFMATRAQEVGRIIKLFGAGTGLSDADRAFAQKAAAGDITMNEESIRRILDINDKAARNIISNFNQDASKIDPTLSPYPLTVDIPEVVAPASPGQGLRPGNIEVDDATGDRYQFKGGDPSNPDNWKKM